MKFTQLETSTIYKNNYPYANLNHGIQQHTKHLYRNQNKFDGNIGAKILDVNVNDAILNIDRKMENLRFDNTNFTCEQHKQDQLKFISSKNGTKIEDVYKVGIKLGQGGQGSVYSGSFMCCNFNSKFKNIYFMVIFTYILK